MPSAVEIENNVVNAEKYFAQQMDKLVSKSLEMEKANDSFSKRVNSLFEYIEANRFMLKNNIDTTDKVFLGVYGKMMCAIGIYANNITKDNSLIIPEI